MKKDHVYTGPSTIQGTGVFAAKDFKAGETVMAWDTSHQLKESEFDALGDDKKYIAHLDGVNIFLQAPERYVCHSCDPNMVGEHFQYKATRDIAQDEELTARYSDTIPLGVDCLCSVCKNK